MELVKSKTFFPLMKHDHIKLVSKFSTHYSELFNSTYSFPINNDLILKNYIKKPIQVIYYSTANGIELMQRCSMLIT
jgi:hypothetical protein